MRCVWPLLAIFLLSACPKPAAPLVPSPKVQHDVSEAELAALTIPPISSTLDILGRLEAQADEGDVQAAWHRTHYLLDLFDSTRFAEDEKSRQALATLSGRPMSAMRGSAATEAITELLLLEVDHLLELDRKHSLAQQARSLIRFDSEPPEARAQVFQRIEELKRVVAKKSILSTAARLRLFAYCRVALQDAQLLQGPRKRVASSHCLYPLYSSDPTPYFAKKAGQRPPPPELRELIIDLGALIENTSWPRLSSSVQAQKTWIVEFTAALSGQSSVSDLSLRLAPATQVTPYDDYPLLAMPKESLEIEAAKLRGPLLTDQRGVAAIAFASETPGSTTLRAALVAAAAGADALAVLVSMRQSLSVPKGDYGSSRVRGGAVTRVGEMHWSLALIEGHKESPASSGAKATSWDPRRAKLRLHLEIAPKEWRLTSPDGDLLRIETSTKETHPSVKLRSRLLAIRSAYPDEDGLILVAAAGSSHGAMVAAAGAARVDDKGRALFAQLAIAAKAPARRAGAALVKRIDRRAEAQVAVTPAQLSERDPVARRCYQDLHDKRRAPVGEIRMELDGKGGIKSSGRGASLIRCAEKAYGGAMLEAKIPSVSVRFSAQAK